MIEIAPDFFVSGGTLPLDSESYIERLADSELLRHLSSGRYCYVLNSRQMGKSSLSVRTIDRLNASGIQTAFIDLTQIGQNITAEQWYAGLTGEVGRAFGLTPQALKYFKNRSDLNPMQRFFGAIREVVLEQISDPIVIFVDEIDGTRNLPFDTDEFYAGIRECYNRRVHDKSCQRLTFCLIGVAVPNDLVRNPTVTPFNIGERIRLQDFTPEEVQRFGPALGPAGDRLARRVHYWTNGQPFLTQSLCREIAADTRIQEERDVDALVQRLYFGPKALETNLNLADVANRVLWDAEQSADPDKYRANLLSAYERTWKGGSIADDEANRVAVVLKLSGLLRSQGARLVTRNRIYHHVFSRAWIEASMPNQELVRQTQSFRRGLVRGIGLAALVGGAIAGMAVLAFREREDAIDAKSALEYELYVAQMNSLSLLEASGDQAGMAAVLERSRSNPHRGFEWNFWMGRLHDAVEEYTFDYSAPGKDEFGIMSQDGRQICVVDRLARTIAVVDRRSKRVLAGADINARTIMASKAGFLSVAEFNGTKPIDDPTTITNFESGKEVSRIGTPGYVIRGVSHRDQSDVVVMEERSVTKNEDRMFTGWNATTGRCLYKNPRPIEPKDRGDPDVLLPIVSKDGSRYVFRDHRPPVGARADANERLAVWDGLTNREVDDIANPSGTSPVTLSESGKLLAYRDELGVLRLRDLDHRRDLYSLDTGVVAPLSIAISPDDRTLICITSDGLATIREIPGGRLLAVRSDLKSISPSGQDSLWVGGSSSVRLLNISMHEQGIVGAPQTIAADGEGALRIATHGRSFIDRLSDPDLLPMQSIPIPRGGKSFTYNRLWCLTPGPAGSTDVCSIGGASPPIRISVAAKNLACGIDSKVFAVLGKDGDWRGISGSTGAVLWTGTTREFNAMWLTRDSSHLIGATETGYIVSCDPMTGKELRRSRAHHLFLSSLTFSRDGREILTGGGDGLAVLWDTGTLEKLQEFRGNTGQAIVGADISPDGSRVATCNDIGDWQIWDSKTGVELTKVRVSNFALRSVTFTADGMKLVTTGDDGLLRTWSGLDRDPTIKIPVPQTNLKDIIFK